MAGEMEEAFGSQAPPGVLEILEAMKPFIEAAAIAVGWHDDSVPDLMPVALHLGLGDCRALCRAIRRARTDL